MSSFLLYLFQVSACHSAFFILYRYFFSKHTFFQSNRIYLLFTSAFSFVIPLLKFGIWNSGSIENSFVSPLYIFSETQINNELWSAISQNAIASGFSVFTILVFTIYSIGVSIYCFRLLNGLWTVVSIIKENEEIDKEGYKIIRIKTGPSFFSFLKFVFINENKLSLSQDDLKSVLFHEKVHMQQKHTIDILFMELVTAICWFNPFVRKTKDALCQIHEFIADDQVVSNTRDVETYSRLILKISSDNKPMPLTHQFSMINIKNRITMLNQTKHHVMKTLKYLFTIPMSLLLMSFFSFTEKSAVSSSNYSDSLYGGKELIIEEILWEGNKKYSDDFLSGILKIKKGDIYNREKIDNELYYNPRKTALTDLYMNEGHLFFSIKIEEKVVDNSIHLKFVVYEGNTIEIDKIIIKGNTKVETAKVMDMIEFKKGDLFNRSKLIQSQKNIAESGFFKSDEVGINPIPHDEMVDIEFVLIEL